MIKNMIKRVIFGIKLFRRASISCCINNSLLPTIFTRTPADKLRQLMLLPESPHVTQLNQDIFALLANRFGQGYFLEIGANDGFTLSNTVYLEQKFGWTGLLVEANPKYRDNLKQRESKSLIAAIVEKEGYYKFCDANLYGGVTEHLDKTHERITKDAATICVWGTTLERVLEENDSPPIINFISIDVEGAEVPIVEQMCSVQGYRFVCGCIEHNYRSEDYQRISQLLSDAGYRVIWEGQTAHDLYFVDDRSFA